MRVRPHRALITRRTDRSSHPPLRPVTAPPESPEHPHQRRAKRSGGPVDTASYACGCGLVFDAAVSTTVACPHCGAGQAW